MNKLGQLTLNSILIVFIILMFSGCKEAKSDIAPEIEEKVTAGKFGPVADSISLLMNQYHYNPAELKTEQYLKIEEQFKQLAGTAQHEEDFVSQFNTLWKDGPFSHVRLAIAQQSAAAMANYVDTMKVGQQGAQLQWQDEVAIFTVNTMMGADTIERIFEAYQEIDKKEVKALIIDLRNNEGGAFAIVPLIGHVIDQDIDAGIFVSRKWWQNNTVAPTMTDVLDLEPWQGWSIKSFWKEVQEVSALRVKFEAMQPRFEGPVYVLTSNITASAAEFATDALANSNSVTIIGEVTAGEMLSQKMYDLPQGFQLSLPIAEYYSTRTGRIEGKGVKPDIAVKSQEALQVAKGLIAGQELENILTNNRK